MSSFGQEVTIRLAIAVPADSNPALRSDALVYILGMGLFECVDENTYIKISKVLSPKGVWSSATTYSLYDIVTYQGSSYLAITTSINITPISDDTKWQLMAQKGLNGSGGGSLSGFSVPLLANYTGDTITYIG